MVQRETQGGRRDGVGTAERRCVEGNGMLGTETRTTATGQDVDGWPSETEAVVAT